MHTGIESDRAEQLASRILLGILCFSPLAFGTVETWSLLVMESGLFLALFLLMGRKSPGNPFEPAPGIIPLALFLLYLLLQIVPLPPALISIVSPSAAARYRETIWAADPAAWAPVSLYPKGTVSEFLRVAAFGGAYIMAVPLFSDSRRFRKAALLLAAYAGVLALFAILQHLLSNNRIYWLRELTQGGTPFGPYVNRNHFAGLMAMLLPFCIAFFLTTRPSASGDSLRTKAASMLGRTSSNISLLIGCGTLLTGLSVFLSISRGGILSLLVSLSFMGMMLRGRDRRGRMALVVILIVLLYAVGWFGWDPIFKRFHAIRTEQGEIAELRIDLWNDTLSMIRDFGVTGTGAGTFLQSYPAYRTLASGGIADHAHNDYLELLATVGIIGTGLLAWFVASVLLSAYRTFRGRKDPSARMLAVGAFAGCAAFLLHGLTDFNFFIGANGLFFFLFLGIAVAASRVSTKEDRIPRNRTGLPARRTFGWAAAVLLASGVLFNAGQILASVLRSDAGRIRLENASAEGLSYVRDSASRASLLDPLDPDSRVLRGGAESLLSHTASAERHLRAAMRLSPADAYILLEYASFLEDTGKRTEAERLFASSRAASPSDPLVLRRCAGFLLRNGRREEALALFQAALLHEPGRTREFTAMLVLEGLSHKELLRVLPESVPSRIGFAEYLDATGYTDEALAVFEEARRLLVQSPQVPQGLYWQMAKFADRQGNTRDALSVMRLAEPRFPNDAGIAMAIGGYAEKLGLHDEAVAAYQRALAISPANKKAKDRLQALSGT